MELPERFTPLNDEFPLKRQLDISASPIVLINTFTVGAGDEGRFLKAFFSAG